MPSETTQPSRGSHLPITDLTVETAMQNYAQDDSNKTTDSGLSFEAEPTGLETEATSEESEMVDTSQGQKNSRPAYTPGVSQTSQTRIPPTPQGASSMILMVTLALVVLLTIVALLL